MLNILTLATFVVHYKTLSVINKRGNVRMTQYKACLRNNCCRRKAVSINIL
jgi:hypothetical protein